MKKILAFCVFAVSISKSVYGVDTIVEERNLYSPSSYQECAGLEEPGLFAKDVISKGAHTSVYTAAELASAIQTAAVNVHESTTITIHGVIPGNFVVPASVHTIRLVGENNKASITANESGTPLIISLGATVVIEDLIITQADTEVGYGIINNGTLKISRSFIINNGIGGISNFGEICMTHTHVSNNHGYGIYIQQGGSVKAKHSHIDDNTSTGIYTFSGSITLEKSTINGNGDNGLYNYYGTQLRMDDCKASENTGYGIQNSYCALVVIKDSSINSNSSTGIYNEGTQCNIEKSTISQNTGTGIYNFTYGVALVDDCMIEGNTSGGVHNNDTTVLNVKRTTFKNNTASQGGAIYNDSSSSATAMDCSFFNNFGSTGGAIYNANECTIEHSKVKDNSSTSNGAGIYNAAGASLIIRDTHIEENISTGGNGGGLYNLGLATAIHAPFTRNTAVNGGGIANITTGSLLLIKSNVKKNTATFGVGGGGGIYNTGVALTLTHSHVYENYPDQIQ